MGNDNGGWLIALSISDWILIVNEFHPLLSIDWFAFRLISSSIIRSMCHYLFSTKVDKDSIRKTKCKLQLIDLFGESVDHDGNLHTLKEN